MDNRIVCNNVDFDYLPRPEQRLMQERLLRRLISQVHDHPLVAQRLAGFAERERADGFWDAFHAIPVVQTGDNRPMLAQRRAAGSRLPGEHGGSMILSSGGTTGLPKLSWLTFDEMHRGARLHGKGYASGGIGPDDCVLTFSLPGPLSSESTVLAALSVTGCVVIPAGSVEYTDELIDLAHDLGVTALLVMSTDLVQMLQRLEARGERLEHVRLVLGGGEVFPASVRAYARRLLGNGDLVIRSIFQTNEAGPIGFQCPHNDDDVFHLQEELVYVEVRENGSPGAGTLVATNLDRYLSPAIRIAVGDIVTLLDGGCPCGRTGRTMRVLGREERIMKVGGERFRASLLVDLLSSLGIGPHQASILVTRDDVGRDRVELALDRSVDTDTTRTSIRERLESAYPLLARQLDAGSIGQFRFVSLQPHDLARTAYGKKIWLVDRREEMEGQCP
ncbi:MAG TPA: AMP-binding protein [Nocardioidaceae bacterium]|nr:AMP-binding protein [Nocardioidaceae bacterium]